MQVRNPMPVMACCTILLPVVLLRFERVVVKALVVVQVKVCKVMAMRPCSICVVVERFGFVLVPVDVGDCCCWLPGWISNLVMAVLVVLPMGHLDWSYWRWSSMCLCRIGCLMFFDVVQVSLKAAQLCVKVLL